MLASKVTRREFVLGSLGASALSFTLWAAAAVPGRSSAVQPSVRLHKLLVDSSIPESVRLGAFAGAIAEEVVLFDGDLTRLWNDDLRSQWLAGPRPIAGLTAPGVRLVFEQLGRDFDARIVFSAEHRKVADGMRHVMAGSDSLLSCQGWRGHSDWVSDMAKCLEACPLEPPSRMTSFEYSTCAGEGGSAIQPRLVTWVLGPVSRREQPHHTQEAI